jgi:precorrin-6x reductase
MCEKLSAAEKAGIEVVTVMRPPSEGGVSVDEAKEMIAALWDDSCSLA